jgi:hypothetical protein
MHAEPRRLPVAALHLRSSAALLLAPAIATLIVVNTVLRGHPWDHEWGWAIYQAGFVSVFLGPLCAGIGAWDGAQLARARPTIEATGRPAAARTAAWAAIVTIVAAIYLALLAVLGAVLAARGILDGPGLVDLSPIPGVIALCGAWAAIGIAVGYRWRTALHAPILAAVAFVTTLVAYLTQPLLIKVGGATSSTLFLEPQRSIQVGQLLLYAAIAATALTGRAPRSSARPPRSRRLAHDLAALIAIGAVGFLVTVPDLELRARERPLVCQGTSPKICVASPYRDRIQWPRPYLQPYLDALEGIHIVPPATFSQALDRPAGEGSLPDELLRGHPAAAGPFQSVGPGGSAVLAAYLSDSCDLATNAKAQAAYDLADRWLASITAPGILDDPMVPAVLRHGDDAERAIALQHAFATLASCTT